MENKTAYMLKPIAKIAFATFGISAFILFIGMAYLKYSEWRLQEMTKTIHAMSDYVDVDHFSPDEKLDRLGTFSEEHSRAKYSAAYWLYKLHFLELKGDLTSAQSAFEKAVDTLPPNDLRLFLAIKVLPEGVHQAYEYYYELPNGRKADLRGCIVELELEYQKRARNAEGESSTFFDEINFIDYALYGNRFEDGCSQLITFKRA